MPDQDTFAEAVAAARAGRRAQARLLLGRLLRADQANPEYWLWLSAVADNERERAQCLQSLVKLDPQHPAARAGLRLLGEGTEATPGQRTGPATTTNSLARSTDRRSAPASAAVSIPPQLIMRALILLAAVAAGGVLIWGAVALGRSIWRPGLALILRTPTPSASATPAASPTLRPSVPLSSSVSMAEYFGVEQTPTPLYGATPHPVVAAYAIGVDAMRSDRWEEAVQYLNQVLVTDPGAADLYQMVAEAQRQMGNLDWARESIAKALNANPRYAPAYLARARLTLLRDPQADVMHDVDRALELDPAFVDAYVERAALHIRAGDLSAADADLQRAFQLDPQHAMAWVTRGRLALLNHDQEGAINAELRAQLIDPTIPMSYFILGQADMNLGLSASALTPLEVYVTYAPDDPQGWLAYGQALLAEGEAHAAIEILSQAVALSPGMIEAYLTRGEAYLVVDDGNGAYRDFHSAYGLDTKVFASRYGAARAFEITNQPREALREIEGALRLAVTSAEKAQALMLRARVRDATGETELALRDWRTIASMPDAPPEILMVALARLVATPSPTPAAH
ncbi:MAG TPA: tetratricopeptide repeat protein [Anaerolineales bacterium]|nr:tetratricopeptide repeat protein [Anaerolineales bacterium]